MSASSACTRMGVLDAGSLIRCVLSWVGVGREEEGGFAGRQRRQRGGMQLQCIRPSIVLKGHIAARVDVMCTMHMDSESTTAASGQLNRSCATRAMHLYMCVQTALSTSEWMPRASLSIAGGRRSCTAHTFTTTWH